MTAIQISERSKKVTDLLLARPDLTAEEVAQLTNTTASDVLSIQETSQASYIRTLADRKKLTVKIEKAITSVTNNISEIHKHTVAMIEALQNSYRIRIVRDVTGGLHYQNMPPDWPNKPNNFDSLPELEQKLALISIDTARLQSFITDLMAVLSMRASNLNFVSKVVKGALPKVDVEVLDVSGIDSNDSALLADENIVDKI